MSDLFERLLRELGPLFHLKLKEDKIHACSIHIHDHLTIQLQPDAHQQHLWIFAKIAELPPGKFREEVFKETLKANALPDPRIAHFGYIANTNHLALFQSYPLLILNAERLAGLIGAIVEMAITWQHAIQSGQIAPNQPPNPFGMK